MQSVLPPNSNRPNIPQPTPEEKRRQQLALEESRRIIREQLAKQGIIPADTVNAPPAPVNTLPGVVPPTVVPNPVNPPVQQVPQKKKVRGVLPKR